jgi:hypothetical protein
MGDFTFKPAGAAMAAIVAGLAPAAAQAGAPAKPDHAAELAAAIAKFAPAVPLAAPQAPIKQRGLFD